MSVSLQETMAKIVQRLEVYKASHGEIFRSTGAKEGLHSGALLELSESTLDGILEEVYAWQTEGPKIARSEEANRLAESQLK